MNARFRTYEYTVYSEPYRNPLRDRFAWHIWPPVELNLLQQAAALLPGTHRFCDDGPRRRRRRGASTVRDDLPGRVAADTGQRYAGLRSQPMLSFYHMVRRLVFLTVMVAVGKLSPGKFIRKFAGRSAANPWSGSATGIGV